MILVKHHTFNGVRDKSGSSQVPYIIYLLCHKRNGRVQGISIHAFHTNYSMLHYNSEHSIDLLLEQKDHNYSFID